MFSLFRVIVRYSLLLSFGAKNPSATNLSASASMARVPSSPRDVMCRLFPDVAVSDIGEGEAHDLAGRFEFPPGVVVRPAASRPYHFLTREEVCFFEAPFLLGLRFPLPNFIREVLYFFGLCPAALLPSAWAILIAFSTAWGRFFPQSRITVSEFLQFYRPEEVSEFYRFIPRRAGETPIPDLPAEPEGWRRRYFFVSGVGWEFGAVFPASARVPVDWGQRRNLSKFLAVPLITTFCYPSALTARAWY